MARDIVVVNEHFSGRVAVEAHASGVPELLRGVDPDLKVFYNMKDHMYEVWGLDKRGPYVLGAWEKLGPHVVEAVRKGYYLAHNKSRPWRAFLEDVRKRNARQAASASAEANELERALRDDFRYFGTTLWPGWSGKR